MLELQRLVSQHISRSSCISLWEAGVQGAWVISITSTSLKQRSLSAGTTWSHSWVLAFSSLTKENLKITSLFSSFVFLSKKCVSLLYWFFQISWCKNLVWGDKGKTRYLVLITSLTHPCVLFFFPMNVESHLFC